MTEGMKKQAQELIGQAYQKGYKAGQNSNAEQYDKAWSEQAKDYIEIGRNEAWEVVRKISKMESYKLNDIFGEGWFWDIFNKFSASEVIERFRKYEDEIKVGDEVIINENAISSFKPNTKAIVITIDDGCLPCAYNVMIANGDTDWLDKDEIHKTGRHFPELAELLQKLKEGE